MQPVASTSKITLDILAASQSQAAQGKRRFNKRQSLPTCTQSTTLTNWTTCYPTSDSPALVEDIWSRVIWNPNYPAYVNATYLDIYLFEATTGMQVKLWSRVTNAQAQVAIMPNERWWPSELNWPIGQNITLPYYFIFKAHDDPLQEGDAREPTFQVIQTSPPSYLASSVSSASASLASISAASVAAFLATGSVTLTLPETTQTVPASASVAFALPSQPTTTLIAASIAGYQSSFRSALAASSSNAAASSASASSSRSSNTGSGGSLQPQNRSSPGLPNYAIAVIAVLGALLLIALLIGLYFLSCVHRRKERKRSDRNEADSAATTPMLHTGDMENATTPRSAAIPAFGHARPSTPDEDTSLLVGSSRAQSKQRDADNDTARATPDTAISGAEAAAMAAAFRKALRKPSFDHSDSTHSGSTQNATPQPSPSETVHRPMQGDLRSSIMLPESLEAERILTNELASEGQSIRKTSRKKPSIYFNSNEN